MTSFFLTELVDHRSNHKSGSSSDLNSLTVSVYVSSKETGKALKEVLDYLFTSDERVMSEGEQTHSTIPARTARNWLKKLDLTYGRVGKGSSKMGINRRMSKNTGRRFLRLL